MSGDKSGAINQNWLLYHCVHVTFHILETLQICAGFAGGSSTWCLGTYVRIKFQLHNGGPQRIAAS